MEEDRRLKGKIMMCGTAARKIKNTIMKDIREAESDIAAACSLFHKRHEQKTGRTIDTIEEFEQVTREFSRLPRSELDKLIEEGKKDTKLQHALRAIRKG